MNLKEKQQLAILAKKILEFTEAFHPPAIDPLVCVLQKAEDEDVMEVLTRHMENLHIYGVYTRFDREASIRDIGELSLIIDNMKQGDQND